MVVYSMCDNGNAFINKIDQPISRDAVQRYDVREQFGGFPRTFIEITPFDRLLQGRLFQTYYGERFRSPHRGHKIEKFGDGV